MIFVTVWCYSETTNFFFSIFALKIRLLSIHCVLLDEVWTWMRCLSDFDACFFALLIASDLHLHYVLCLSLKPPAFKGATF